MTNEEAIDILKIAKSDIEWNYPMNYQEALDLAIKQIEKQIPKKPNEGEYKFFPVCPNCDMHLDADDEWVMTRNYEKGEERFCLYCGQALDWGD